MIWCTGVGGDLSWLRVPVFDEAGRPAHSRGVAAVPGVYFVGFPWLARRGSGIIYGVGRDAEHVADVIGLRLGVSSTVNGA
ncbi:MAG: hypothetical protein O3B31_08750 [Chloroflexi bacterium]|nr:hypothetical protein [Chloroflexota bacterium]MDA1003415.1 hypothetical protein [Chloroflexota bacterium]